MICLFDRILIYWPWALKWEEEEINLKLKIHDEFIHSTGGMAQFFILSQRSVEVRFIYLIFVVTKSEILPFFEKIPEAWLFIAGKLNSLTNVSPRCGFHLYLTKERQTQLMDPLLRVHRKQQSMWSKTRGTAVLWVSYSRGVQFSNELMWFDAMN